MAHGVGKGGVCRISAFGKLTRNSRHSRPEWARLGPQLAGEILESFVTKKRDKAAALTFLKKALKRHGKFETIATDGLCSYPAAMRELGNLNHREMGCWLNNRAENSHLPFRRRERATLRFRRMKTQQKFASVHANVHNHFN